MTSHRHELVPELVLAQRSRDERVLPSEANDVRAWAGNVGPIFGYEASGANWIHVEGIGTFRFVSGGLRVAAFPAADASASTLRDVYERSVLPLVLQAAGRQVLHASAVRDDNAVTALAGASRSGKSTIAGALAKRGHALWADDAVAFKPTGEGVDTVSLPFAPRLRPAAAEHVTGLTRVDNGSRSAMPLAAIIVLTQSPHAAEPRPDRIKGSAAFHALLPHAYCFTLRDRAENRKLTEDYLALAERVPVWSLRYRPNLNALPRIVDVLETFLQRA